jgi:hypothetical protein
MEDTFPDLGSLSDEELKDLIDKRPGGERDLHKRRVLHGVIDISARSWLTGCARHERGDTLFSGMTSPS